MQAQRLEARVLDLIDAVVADRRVEDDRVELKSLWPTDYRRAARQIAGLANTAGGEPVLWVVGVDEDAGKVVDPGGVEFADWWARVERCFDEVAPSPALLTVATADGSRVTAIEFDTSRAPYVVTTDGQGQIGREIPWRSGNSTRSAKRSEILRSVLAEAVTPKLSLISGTGGFEMRDREPISSRDTATEQPGRQPDLQFSTQLRLFVEAVDEVMLPQHLWRCELVSENGDAWPLKMYLSGPTASGAGINSIRDRIRSGGAEKAGTIEYVDGSGLRIAGSDSISLRAHGYLGVLGDDREPIMRASAYEISLRLPIALSSRVVAARIRLEHDDDQVGSSGRYTARRVD